MAQPSWQRRVPSDSQSQSPPTAPHFARPASCQWQRSTTTTSPSGSPSMPRANAPHLGQWRASVCGDSLGGIDIRTALQQQQQRCSAAPAAPTAAVRAARGPQVVSTLRDALGGAREEAGQSGGGAGTSALEDVAEMLPEREKSFALDADIVLLWVCRDPQATVADEIFLQSAVKRRLFTKCFASSGELKKWLSFVGAKELRGLRVVTDRLRPEDGGECAAETVLAVVRNVFFLKEVPIAVYESGKTQQASPGPEDPLRRARKVFFPSDMATLVSFVTDGRTR
eukprot:m51a1_g660 hypothetical protein (283) ;mRNA; r:230506-231574